MFRKKPKENIEPEWLIVGLGNPGGEYAGTRHNAGFGAVEALAAKHKVKLDKSRFQARYGIGRLFGVGVAICKPLTYMNRSGQAVSDLRRHFGMPIEKVLVIADDTDLPVGRVRIRMGGSAGGHNGHKSLIERLGSSEYPRIKLGIGRVDKDETIDYVLSPFLPDERDAVRKMEDLAIEAVEIMLERGIEAAMNEIHSKC